jgi:hypothetical protein
MRMVGAGLSTAIGVALLPADALAGVDQWTELVPPPFTGKSPECDRSPGR